MPPGITAERNTCHPLSLTCMLTLVWKNKEITRDYQKLLEITRDYWRLLEILQKHLQETNLSLNSMLTLVQKNKMPEVASPLSTSFLQPCINTLLDYTRDYQRLLEITADYQRLLQITRGYCRNTYRKLLRVSWRQFSPEILHVGLHAIFIAANETIKCLWEAFNGNGNRNGN